MADVYLFTGENHFELRTHVLYWVSEFTSKHGAENIVRVQAKQAKASALMNELAAAPFIAEKRLCIIEGIPKLEKGDFGRIVDVIHPQVLTVFVDPKPDKRLSSTKELLELATVKTFTPLNDAKIVPWMQQYATQHGADLPQKSAQRLLQIVGNDQQLLAKEIEKLATFADESIAPIDVETLTVCVGEQASWYLLDLISSGNTKEALRFCKKLIEAGESAHGIWARVLWMVTQLIAVKGAVDEGITSPQAICKQAGVTFGSARTLTRKAKSMTVQQIHSLCSRIADIDTALKTGELRSTVESPEEIESVVDSTICLLSA